jgi:hypothetical protein
MSRTRSLSNLPSLLYTAVAAAVPNSAVQHQHGVQHSVFSTRESLALSENNIIYPTDTPLSTVSSNNFVRKKTQARVVPRLFNNVDVTEK